MPRAKALTFVELIVSVVILALIIGGLANIFVTARRYIAYNRSRIQAVEFNKRILNSFYATVKQDDWNQDSNPIYVPPGGSRTATNDTINLNNILYVSSYTVSDMNNITYGNALLRKVKMSINWTEPF